jgi:hypothetical protein
MLSILTFRLPTLPIRWYPYAFLKSSSATPTRYPPQPQYTMPIQRPSKREQWPLALDVFTGREELIAAFERNLVLKMPEEHWVLVFYGCSQQP